MPVGKIDTQMKVLTIVLFGSVCKCVYVSMCVCMHVCVCMYVDVYMYIYMYEAERNK